MWLPTGFVAVLGSAPCQATPTPLHPSHLPHPQMMWDEWDEQRSGGASTKLHLFVQARRHAAGVPAGGVGGLASEARTAEPARPLFTSGALIRVPAASTTLCAIGTAVAQPL